MYWIGANPLPLCFYNLIYYQNPLVCASFFIAVYEEKCHAVGHPGNRKKEGGCPLTGPAKQLIVIFYDFEITFNQEFTWPLEKHAPWVN